MMVVDKLEEILLSRKRQVARDKEKVSFSEMERLAQEQRAPANFYDTLNQPKRITVIAEMKRRSPSAGAIRPEFDAARVAEAYEKGGASALSILTEPDFFGGSINDLKRTHDACPLPILRKEFIFDPYQVVEAKAFGASAILLIADMVSPSLLKELAACAFENGLSALVEIFTAGSLEAALQTESKILGINTRNLRTLEMNPNQVRDLCKEIPADRLVVAESGIKTPADIDKLKALRVAAVLVGESLLHQNDMTKAVQALVKAGER